MNKPYITRTPVHETAAPEMWAVLSINTSAVLTVFGDLIQSDRNAAEHRKGVCVICVCVQIRLFAGSMRPAGCSPIRLAQTTGSTKSHRVDRRGTDKTQGSKPDNNIRGRPVDELFSKHFPLPVLPVLDYFFQHLVFIIGPSFTCDKLPPSVFCRLNPAAAAVGPAPVVTLYRTDTLWRAGSWSCHNPHWRARSVA